MSCYSQHLELQSSCLTSDVRVLRCDFTVFCACQGEFLVSFFPPLASTRYFCDSILQANHFMGVTTSCVFCLSKDIEKSSTTSICGLLSNLFDVSLHSSLPLVPLHPVLLSFALPLMTPSLHFCCYYLHPAYL